MVLFQFLEVIGVFGDYPWIEYLCHALIMPSTTRNSIRSNEPPKERPRVPVRVGRSVTPLANTVMRQQIAIRSSADAFRIVRRVMLDDALKAVVNEVGPPF